MTSLRDLVAGDELVVAPVALNPIMARLARQQGFRAVYLSGGSLGWVKCVTEANLTLPELVDVAIDMRAVCDLPIILATGHSDDVASRRIGTEGLRALLRKPYEPEELVAAVRDALDA